MKMKTTLLMLLTFSTAALPGAERFGLARSSDAFTVVRQQESIPARAGVITSIENGDVISTADRPVQIDLETGDSYAIGRESEVTVSTDGKVLLDKGHLAASIQGSSDAHIGFDNLTIRSADQSAATEPSMLAMTVINPGQVKVLGVSGTFTATQTNPSDANQSRGVGIIGKGDSLIFVNRGGEWYMFPERMGQPAPVDDGLVRTQASVEDDDDDEAGAWWPYAAGGAALLGGAAYWYYDDQDDEDDEHREERNREEREDEEGRGEFSEVAPDA